MDDVDLVVVAAFDDRKNPQQIQVYKFDAAVVRDRFNAAYAARTKAKLLQKDNCGMWLSLDTINQHSPRSVGTGLADEYPPIAVYSIDELIAKNVDAHGFHGTSDYGRYRAPSSIAEVVDRARQQISALAGVDANAVKLELKIEY